MAKQKQLEETKLRRRKVTNRRGVFSTYGYDSWECVLARASEGDLADAFEQCADVGAVERDIMADVLAGDWTPPVGRWLLAVQEDITPWTTLVTNQSADAIRKRIGRQFRGQMLSTGHSDASGAVFVLLTEGDNDVLRFVTDGTPWDDDDDEIEELFPTELSGPGLEGTGLDRDWLDAFDNASDAHQAVVQHLDAYVPGLVFAEGQLQAAYGHEDVLSHVTRIDLVRIGRVAAGEPSRKQLAATRRLHDAIRADDVNAVAAALQKDALLTAVDGQPPALWSLCFQLGYAPENGLTILELLLDAGADVNEAHGETPLARVVGNVRDLDLNEAATRRLVAAEADLNPAAAYTLHPGARPLHRAAQQGKLRLVELLLELGADPTATDDAGQTPRLSLLALREQQLDAPLHQALLRALGDPTSDEDDWHAEDLRTDAAIVEHLDAAEREWTTT